PKLQTDIIGAAIEGEIIDLKRNQVKFHLDMDESQQAGGARWFPYDANLLKKVKPVRDPELTKKYKAHVMKEIIKLYYHRDKESAKKLIDKVKYDLDPVHIWDLGLDGPVIKKKFGLIN
ncbi:hypothetical protein RSX24_032005, partial [Paenibacillus sp. ES5-4]